MTVNRVPGMLRDLWRDRAQNLASNVAHGGRDHREIAHAASLIRQDYRNRFLVELIQNANDQALRGGVYDSTVVVIRTEQFLAVSNGGQPLSQSNLERISSLADSDKSGILVGNKGVGFKAVYQISDCPEVYSAGEGGRDDSGDVCSNFRLGFALQQDPFDSAQLVSSIEEDVRQFANENTGIANAFIAKGFDDPMKAVQPELSQMAGFKFPLPRSRQDLAQRMEHLSIPKEFLPQIRTIVVLPLRDSAAKMEVERAIDKLVGLENDGAGQVEQAILFLQGIGKIVILDHVRNQRWIFTRVSSIKAVGVHQATVLVCAPDGSERKSVYWLHRRGLLDCPPEIASRRKLIVEASLRDFGLEAWAADDHVPITVALPFLPDGLALPLGPPGRFCLGLPTEEPTGLPALVDSRFFATISRTGLDFSIPYNSLLLEVASQLFGELLQHLRQSARLEDRRTVTLALHRTKGVLADRIFAPGGVADGEVVLTWGGVRFASRPDCRMPDLSERVLLNFIRDNPSIRSDFVQDLPEEGLILTAVAVLESIILPPLRTTIHRWLIHGEERESALESTATLHRLDGVQFWAGFVNAVLECFSAVEVAGQSIIPVGDKELASPEQKVFLPAAAETASDDDEVASVPSRVAAMIRLVDGNAMPLREGKNLTVLALRLENNGLVRRPRKKELLEQSLFPALEKSSEDANEVAMELFGQALLWIASMNETSRKQLDCKRARVPVVFNSPRGYIWQKANEVYLGEGWGLGPQHDDLLHKAYPEKRLLPIATINDLVTSGMGSTINWSAAVKAMGVNPLPRIIHFKPNPPLRSGDCKLQVSGEPSLGVVGLDDIYRKYAVYLTRFGSDWIRPFKHNVDKTVWIDGLELEDRRHSIVDLMLMHPDRFLPTSTVGLGREYHDPTRTVPSMWNFALLNLGWSIFPAECGAGGERTRVSASNLWQVSAAERRKGFAQVINVVPETFSGATRLLEAVGVSSFECAQIETLLYGLNNLALRLDEEHLHTKGEALSLANELYEQICRRLEKDDLQQIPDKVCLPLLRDQRLEAVNPNDQTVLIVIDDDPGRAQHIPGLKAGFRVPIARAASLRGLHSLFERSFGAQRVVLTSSAKMNLQFVPLKGGEQFLDWLRREYPHVRVASELAALLTFRSDRGVRAEPVSRHWKSFEGLTIVVGSFDDEKISSFYDRPTNALWVRTGLTNHEIVGKTWEVAGVRVQDLWAGYSQALKEKSTGLFLHERNISEVEIVSVADAAALHHPTRIKALAPVLLAAHCHAFASATLDDSAAWLASLGDRCEDVAKAFDRPDLEGVLKVALGLRFPESELHVLRYLTVPWSLWQDAVQREHGERHTFKESTRRYEEVISHFIAVARETAVKDATCNLESLGKAITNVLTAEVPVSVKHRPVEVADAELTALCKVRDSLATFELIWQALGEIPSLPWGKDLPIPKSAKQRGVRLFGENEKIREINATTSTMAIIEIAKRLAKSRSEHVDSELILANPGLVARMHGEWAHVFAALSFLRPLLQTDAPETVKRLVTIQAFRDASTLESLLGKLPELNLPRPEVPQPKVALLGVELTKAEVVLDLLSGGAGVLGGKLIAAAFQPIEPSILNGKRAPLLFPNGRGGNGGSGSSGGRSSPHERREPETVGDIGEAFVHEWLGYVLGENYGPECWLSKARERYGFPACGNDSLGYDFKVPDPSGLLFGTPCPAFLIEVKSTSTDGRGPFPMSRSEWDKARHCNESISDGTYVIIRVFDAMDTPRIGDVVLDPFGAYRQGVILLTDRDLWITVAPLIVEHPWSTL